MSDFTSAVLNTVRDSNGLAPQLTYLALFTTAPTGTTAGTEVTGGTYARKPITFASGVGSVTFDVPAGVTVKGTGFYSAATGGTYLGGRSLAADGKADEVFSSAGTYPVTINLAAV